MLEEEELSYPWHQNESNFFKRIMYKKINNNKRQRIET